jgi:hypothetical protein
MGDSWLEVQVARLLANVELAKGDYGAGVVVMVGRKSWHCVQQSIGVQALRIGRWALMSIVC